MEYANYISKKICKNCPDNGLQSINNFNAVKDHRGYFVFRNICKKCIKKRNLENHLKNPEKRKQYKQAVKNKKKNYDKNYRLKNFDNLKLKKKKYYQNNKEKVLIKQKEYTSSSKYKLSRNLKLKNRRVNDINFRLYHNILASLHRNFLLKNNTKKIKLIGYSIQELKNHLEKQFEPWMSWNNWGRYNKLTWLDNNPSTWTWQIDHIIPVSVFNGKDRGEIIKCWSLSNLRPYSAKLNCIDGANKTRHK